MVCLQAEQADIWHVVTGRTPDIADGRGDRQHVISPHIEGRRQGFGQHQLLVTDEYLHFPAPSRSNTSAATPTGAASSTSTEAALVSVRLGLRCGTSSCKKGPQAPHALDVRDAAAIEDARRSARLPPRSPQRPARRTQ